MITIEDFIKEEKKWLNYAKSICKDNYQDLLQDVYCKLLKIQSDKGCLSHICYKGQPNQAWMYITMRNLHLSRVEKKNPLTIDLTAIVDNSKEILEEDIETLLEVISELNKDPISSYECKYFMLKVLSGKSYRKLAKEMGTTTRIIQNAVNNAKKNIKERFEQRADQRNRKLNDLNGAFQQGNI